jgi:hypothetical protein
MRRGTTTQRAVSGLVAVGFAVGLAGGVAGGLAGCTNYPEPSHLPTPTEAVTPSPTPTATATAAPDAASVPPERPAAMDVADSAGAEAVAAYYLQLYGYVYATNDLAEWRELSHAECVFCASVIDNIEAQISAGQHCTGGLVEVSDVSSLEVDPGHWWTVNVDLVQAGSQKLNAAGELVEDFPEAKAYRMDLAVIYDGGVWSVRAVDHQETES